MWKTAIPLMAAAMVLGDAAFAQEKSDALERYPARPIRLIVPFPPGGGTDTLSRLVGKGLGERLGQSIVIDNRPGAGTTIGATLAARSEPNGYTLYMGTSALMVAPAFYPEFTIDPARDYSPITLVSTTPSVLAVHPSVAATSVSQLVALAKSQPGRLAFASAGNGTASHLAGALLQTMTGAKLVHVPYKGSGPAVTDLIAGQVQLFFDSMVTLMPHVRGGRIRALAVTSAQRSPAAPELPTVAESGLPGFQISPWSGLMGPARMPGALVERLNREVVAIVHGAAFRDTLARQGSIPVGNSPAEFTAFIASELAKWGSLARSSGARAD
ncbi:MAG: tripartite tricarboxylate transporter substrate binding protein [Burkholderiales bacterium]|nr:tripartite tricarboxylate transporter substrate binding protein [Burkholderiales bacterium]